MPNVDELLERARRRLQRITPEQAAAEHAKGALLVDTRTSEQRARDGEIPGALAIDRTVVEWRLDPASPFRIAPAIDHKIRVIVVCAEGFSSSLAAASLQDRKSTRLNSSHTVISYAVFCLKKKNTK